jgi:hypothetical protein
MAITGYRAITFEPSDLLSDWVLDQMNSNIQALHDYTPRAKYTATERGVSTGINREEQIKIASGRVLIPKQGKKNEASESVNFRGFFTNGCQPNVSLGVNSRQQQNIYCTFSGLPGHGLLPDHNGFTVHILIGEEDGEKKKIARPFYVHWVAMGY